MPRRHAFRFLSASWQGTVIVTSAGKAWDTWILEDKEIAAHAEKLVAGGTQAAAELAVRGFLAKKTSAATKLRVHLSKQADGLKPGEYYPRVWRPRSEWTITAADVAARTDSRVAASHLEVAARDLFRVLDPSGKRNRQAYGHAIRELLILACTEAEAAIKDTLTANSVRRSRFTTNHYVAVRDPLGLADMELRLPDYPEHPELRPFESWDVASPTKSISWYDAYNKTKHSRKDNFHEANLLNAITALAAVWALHWGRFGPQATREDSTLFRGGRRDAYDPADGYLATPNLSDAKIRRYKFNCPG